MGKPMLWYTKLAYGLGHFFNDLCASMWFTYLLIFFDQVLGFTGVEAGILLLIGQLADGIATPIVGALCDKKVNNAFIAKYGRRKLWHLGGSILVGMTFPFIWSECLVCSGNSCGTDKALPMVYFSFFIIFFQFGWAATQISHLALIPDLTTKKKQRTELSSIRYAFTVIANLSVYTILFIVLDSGNCADNGIHTTIATTNTTEFPPETTDTTSSTTEEFDCSELGPDDANKFTTAALICLGIGLVFTLLFQLGVHEKPYTVHRKESYNKGRRPSLKNAMKKIDWFKERPFYQIAVLYMATRLYVNLYQSYIVLYIQETLNLPVDTVATVPFVMYAAGFAGSIVMKYINSKIGRKATFTLGCLVGLSGCVWVGLDRSDQFKEWGIYLVASLLGIGGSTLLITSLSLTADLIGDNIEGGAFVYGFMSLVDKFSNGIIIMIIQYFGDHQADDSNFYQMVITYACGSSCVLGILVIITLINRRINTRTNVRRKSTLVISTFDDAQQDDDSEGGMDNPACEEKDDTIAVSVIKDCGIINTTAAAVTAITKCSQNNDDSNSTEENQNQNKVTEGSEIKVKTKKEKDDTIAVSAIKDCGVINTTAAAVTAITKCSKNNDDSKSTEENQNQNKVNEGSEIKIKTKKEKDDTIAVSAIKDCGVINTTAAAVTAITKCSKNNDDSNSTEENQNQNKVNEGSEIKIKTKKEKDDTIDVKCTKDSEDKKDISGYINGSLHIE